MYYVLCIILYYIILYYIIYISTVHTHMLAICSPNKIVAVLRNKVSRPVRIFPAISGLHFFFWVSITTSFPSKTWWMIFLNVLSWWIAVMKLHRIAGFNRIFCGWSDPSGNPVVWSTGRSTPRRFTRFRVHHPQLLQLWWQRAINVEFQPVVPTIFLGFLGVP